MLEDRLKNITWILQEDYLHILICNLQHVIIFVNFIYSAVLKILCQLEI